MICRPKSRARATDPPSPISMWMDGQGGGALFDHQAKLLRLAVAVAEGGAVGADLPLRHDQRQGFGRALGGLDHLVEARQPEAFDLPVVRKLKATGEEVSNDPTFGLTVHPASSTTAATVIAACLKRLSMVITFPSSDFSDT